MKSILLILLMASFQEVFSQNTKERNEFITPKLQLNIKQNIEKEIPTFKQKMSKYKPEHYDQEFMVDTFRINRFEQEWLKLNDSDESITEVIVTTTNMYDVLLNKYYKKIATLLDSKDKATLIQAQRSWLSYRDNERKLNELVAGIQFEGGTLQILTNASSYKNIVTDRVKRLFQDYHAILQNVKYEEVK